MDDMALGAYFVATLAFMAAPGPIITVVVARALAGNTMACGLLVTGVCLGQLAEVGAIAIGLGDLARSEPRWFAMAKYVGIVYMLWLAQRLWRDSSVASVTQLSTKSGWLAGLGAGLALCLANPSTMLFYILVLPSVAPAGVASADELAALLLVTLAAVAAVYFGAMLVAGRFQRIVSSSASSGRLNRWAAVVITLTSVWMLAG